MLRRLTIAFVLAIAAPAGAATYSTSVSPDPFTPPETIGYRLNVTTGSEPATLTITAQAPHDNQDWFNVLEQAGPPVLEGPGKLTVRPTPIVIGDRFCAPLLPDYHGGLNSSTPSADVELPADSSSAVVFPYRIDGPAPWRDTNLRVTFSIDSGSGTPVELQTPNPGSRVHGVRIAFETVPAGEPDGCAQSFTTVEHGREIVLRGVADTAAAGQLMTLRAVRSRGEDGCCTSREPIGPAEVLGRVPIGADGSFAYRWHPDVAGDYTVGALYESRSADLADDYSMPYNLRVAPAPATPAGVRARGTRSGGRIVSRVRGSAAGGACAGTVALVVRSGARRVGRRVAEVGGDCRWSALFATRVSRLPAGARRRYKAGKPVALTVTATSGAATVSRTYRV